MPRRVELKSGSSWSTQVGSLLALITSDVSVLGCGRRLQVATLGSWFPRLNYLSTLRGATGTTPMMIASRTGMILCVRY